MAKLAGERGQLLIAGAILLAVVLVALAILANTAIFTQNLASRSTSVGGTDALEQRHEIADTIGLLVTSVSEKSYPTGSHSNPEDALRAGIQTYGTDLSYQLASNGKTVEVTHVSDSPGKRIEVSNGGTFESGVGSDWVVASSVTQARNFRVEIDKGLLSANPTDDTFDEFIISFRKCGVKWNVHFGEDGGNLVRVTKGDLDPASPPSEEGTCTMDGTGSTAEISITEGYVEGRPCEPLDEIWSGADGITGTFEIQIKNGDQAQGNSWVVVDDGAVPTTSFTDAIFDATVAYRYESQSVDYRTEITVAPGEPND